MKKIMAIILASILIFGVCTFAFAENQPAVPEGYIGIYTAEDLNNIRNGLDGQYILASHIDLSGYSEWSVIGKYGAPFTGEIDGNGYSIIGLTSSRSLLGRTENATIKNLGIVNCNIIQPERTASTSSSAGTFADNAIETSFVNCFASGKIQACVRVGWLALSSSCSAGGLVGVSKNCSFINCYNHTNIHFNYDKISSAGIGGLVGDSYNTTFECCYNTGKISYESSKCESESSNINIGALSGSVDDTTVFKNCYYKDNLDCAVGTQENLVGTGKLTESEIKIEESFEGFDFSEDWYEKELSAPGLKIEKPFFQTEIKINYKDKVSPVLYGNLVISEWKSSKPDVAVVTGNEIEALGKGKTTITILTQDNLCAEVKVTVSYTWWQSIIMYLFFGWIWY